MADVTLHWMQPAGSAAVDEFRVYAGEVAYQGAVVYQGFPTPDAQGVYSTTVQIDELAQGIPMYVWLTAVNGSGESAPSNANLYPEGCDPSVDSDCDGVVDDGAAGAVPCATGQTLNCDDNCPYWPNAGQEDTGGIASDLPDGIGDACQCGDVTGDGRVSLVDYIIMKRALAVPPLATMARPDLCDVGVSAGCTNADSIITLRALQVPPSATITQQCAPALMP